MKIQILIILVLLSSCVCSEFLFLDSSLPSNNLMVCSSVNCEYLNSGNYSTISDISMIKEISNNKYQKIDIWDTLMGDSDFFVFAIIVMSLIFFGIRMIRGGNKK